MFLPPASIRSDATAAPDHTRKSSAEAPVDDAQPSPQDQLLSQIRASPKFRLLRPDAARQWVTAVLECVKGPELDFSGLSETHSKYLSLLAPAGWDAIALHARQMSGSDITSLTLCSHLVGLIMFDGGMHLIKGFNQLAHVTYLELKDPPPGRLDLKSLGHAPVPLQRIRINCTSKPASWEIHVPDGVSVSATSLVPAAEKSWVIFHNKSEKPRRCILDGMIYTRKQAGGSDGLPDNFNMRARWNNGALIRCRHLSLLWVIKRLEQGHSMGRFSFAALSSLEVISKSDPNLEKTYSRIHLAGAQCVLKTDLFGTMLAAEFLKVSVGQARHLFIESPNHVLAVELKRKVDEGVAQCVVVFYDPNTTAIHERAVIGDPSSLAGKPLDHWLTEEAMVDYFGADPDLRLGSVRLYFGADDDAPVRDPDEFLKYVPVSHRMLPVAFYCAMEAGVAGALSDILASLESVWNEPDQQPLDMEGEAESEIENEGDVQLALENVLMASMASAGGGELPGLVAALELGHAAAVDVFLDWVLNKSDALLGADNRYRIALAQSEGWPAAKTAMDAYQVEALCCFTKHIATAKPTTLDPTAKLELLLGRDPADYVAGRSEGRPMLHGFVTMLHEAEDSVAAAETVYRYLGAILESDGVAPFEADILCAARHGATTALQAAYQSGNAAQAGAIVCAILEFGDDKARLLEACGLTAPDASHGVNLPLLLAALESPANDDHAQWIAPIKRWMAGQAQPLPANADPTVRESPPADPVREAQE
ncbi:MAG: ShET2/EspL2 family type III secretion system effector toxin [Pseudomonadota bacterium]